MPDAYSRIASEFAAIDPEYITQSIHADMRQELPWANLIKWEPFSQPGTTYTIPSRPNVVFNDLTEHATTGITAPGADAQAFAMTGRDIITGQKGCDVLVTWKSLEGSQGNLQEYVKDAMKDAYFDKINTDIMANYTDASAAAPDHEIGTLGTPLDYAIFLLAHKLLWKKRARDIFIMIGVDQIEEFLTIPEFKEFLQIGRNVIEQKIDAPTGYLGRTPWGSPSYWCDKASTTGGVTGRGIVADRNALAFVEKMSFDTDINGTQLKNGPRAVRIAGNAWYGTGGRVKTALNNDLMVEVIS